MRFQSGLPILKRTQRGLFHKQTIIEECTPYDLSIEAGVSKPGNAGFCYYTLIYGYVRFREFTYNIYLSLD